jgi:preprotein translocase subunit SecG
MYAAILAIHVVICLALIVVVLMQSGRGASLSSAFGGGGGGQAVFGGRGAAPFLAKATTALAVAFGITSLTLAILSARQPVQSSAIERELQRRGSSQPAPAGQQQSPATQGQGGSQQQMPTTPQSGQTGP